MEYLHFVYVLILNTLSFGDEVIEAIETYLYHFLGGWLMFTKYNFSTVTY